MNPVYAADVLLLHYFDFIGASLSMISLLLELNNFPIIND
jgi:hypothetical protein